MMPDSALPAAPENNPAATGAALRIDLGDYEGPLDVLLELARAEKIDLTRLSLLTLADQYLLFVEQARGAQLELAADYLVMAAWLAYLKSRLLLPDPPQQDDQPSAAEMAEALAFRLRRLDAMRRSATTLFARPRLGLTVFARPPVDLPETQNRIIWDADLPELLLAYARLQQRTANTTLTVEAPDLYAMEQALERLRRWVGHALPDWQTLSALLPAGLTGLVRRSALAAHFVASLELCRQGMLELRQDHWGGALLVRTTTPRLPSADDGDTAPL